MYFRSFLTYGWDYAYGTHFGKLRAQDFVFPKSSKCNLHVYGPSGTRQLYDALWAGSCTLNYSIKVNSNKLKVNSNKYVDKSNQHNFFFSLKLKTILLT